MFFHFDRSFNSQCNRGSHSAVNSPARTTANGGSCERRANMISLLSLDTALAVSIFVALSLALIIIRLISVLVLICVLVCIIAVLSVVIILVRTPQRPRLASAS